MSEHTETRKQLQEIASIRRFDDLLEESTLSDLDKEILRLHYLKHKDFKFIAEFLGYAEVTVKKRHVKALSKLNKLL